jgi:broad specificity phosphatase PhoE
MTRAAGGSYRLVMLRHGQSEWNAQNLFTGWVNAPLTEAGERQAALAGQLPVLSGGHHLRGVAASARSSRR